MTKVVGITGSIATGKSTVTQYLIQHGYEVLDADKLAREAIEKGTSGYQQVIDIFGCVDEHGNIDRKALGKIVFKDAAQKKALEDIIHPYVIEKMKDGIVQTTNEMIFLDIPLLFETHLESLCDKIVVVYIPKEIQKERLMKRNHIDEQAALHLISQQMSIEEKKELADYVLDNTGNHQELYTEIIEMLGVI